MLRKAYFRAIQSNEAPENYLIDMDFPSQAVRGALWRLGTCFLRSFKWRFFLKKVHNLMFVGRNVQIYTPSMLSIGKNFMAEDGVEIVAHSKDGVIFGDNVKIGAYTLIRPSSIFGWEMGEGIVVGNNVLIGPHNFIGFGGKIEIGDYVMTAPHVCIVSTNHSYDDIEVPLRQQPFKNQTIIIENNVWISTNVTILPGVRIGKGSIVGAGSLVNRDVEQYSIVAGVPAHPIKSRK
ncbi:MAG: acyltransferase [Desulfomonilia bacterium]|nr:acyltransferase [Desulfomonilia bacterium]